MRQNKQDITIHSLVRKKQRRKSDIITAGISQKMKTVYVGDKMHTQFIVPINRNSEEVINRYLKSREYK